MKGSFKKMLALVLISAFVLSVAGLASAAWKPTRPIEIVAPAGPGGG